MFSYQIINHPSSFGMDTVRVSQIFENVNKLVGLPQKGILNIAFLSDGEIQTLNNQYRNIDSTTDVLSFHYFEDFEDISPDEVAGEIILSESRIVSQAVEHGHSPEKECEVLIIHSILHILGYDHETDEEYQEMWKYEEVLRNILFSIH